jgi:hypothetical protein
MGKSNDGTYFVAAALLTKMFNTAGAGDQRDTIRQIKIVFPHNSFF